MLNIKRYATLGPACTDRNTLERMFQEGLTGLRCNLSHRRLKDLTEELSLVRSAARAAGVEPELLIDLAGPELRIGELPTDRPLREGELVSFGEGGIPCGEEIRSHLIKGQQVLLDDGKISLQVEEDGGKKARVLRGGVLKSRKSLALPGVEILLPVLSEEDKEDLAAAPGLKITGVMQPFVRSGRDLAEVRRFLRSVGGEGLSLFAKIEDREGVRNLREIASGCDTVVIARGDLGNTYPLWELPLVQEEIACVCRELGRPFLVVTEMLASMEQKPTPTRAEMSDVFLAVRQGAAAVMVTGETAAGKYPVEVVRYLSLAVSAAAREALYCAR